MSARHFDPQRVAIPGDIEALLHQHVRDLRARHYAASTISARSGAVWHFADHCAARGITQAAQVDRSQVERYQRAVAAARRPDGRPLRIATQRERLRHVALFFGWCVRKGHLGANPASDLDYPRPSHRLPPVFSEADIARIFAAVPIHSALGIRDRAILETLYATGMRRLECVTLHVADCDAEAGIVRVRQGKGRKERLVPISTRALAWIGCYRERVRARSIAPLRDEPPQLFLSQRGTPLHPIVLSTLVRKRIAAAGITRPGSCHAFRHSMATHLLEHGCDVRLIQEMLGHSKLDTTARYAHVAIAQMKRAHEACHPSATQLDR